MTSETQAMFSLVEDADEQPSVEGVEEPEQEAPEPEQKQPELPPQDVTKDDPSVRAERLQNALHESRQQAREAKEAAESLRQEMEAREARMAEFVRQKFEQQQAPKPQEPPRPSKEEDPIGYVEWENQQLRERLDRIEKATQQTETRQTQRDQISDIHSQIQSDEQRFMAEHPDYLDAVAHVQRQYAAGLEIQGFEPADITRQLHIMGTQFGASQLQQGKSPAEQFYALAEKWGYQKREAPKEDPKEEAETKPSPLDMIEKGQKQTGLGSGGGDVHRDDDLPDDEFPLLTQAMREIGFK